MTTTGKVGDRGYTAVSRSISHLNRRCQLPVVILSGDTARTTVNELLAAGAAEFLAKPYNLSQFVAMINRYVG